MKANLILFIFFGISLSNTYSQTYCDTTTHLVKYPGGKQMTLQILSCNPNSHKENFFSVMSFDFRYSMRSGFGPFVFEPQFIRFTKDRSHILNCRYLYALLDNKLFESLDNELNFKRQELELWVNFKISSRIKLETNKKMLIGAIDLNENTTGYYGVKTNLPQLNLIMLRLGVNFKQGSVEERIRFPLSIYSADDATQTSLHLNGFKQIYGFIGLSRLRKISVNTKTSLFGKRSSYFFGEIYADYMFNAVYNVFGSHIIENMVYSEYDDIWDRESTILLYKGLLDKELISGIFRHGFRVGVISRGSLASRPKMGVSYGHEISFYPGLKRYSFEFTFLKLALVF